MMTYGCDFLLPVSGMTRLSRNQKTAPTPR